MTLTDSAPSTAELVYVDPFPGRKGHERVSDKACERCSGRGHMVEFGHVHDGICYECNGRGRTSRLVSSARAQERAAVRKANAAREKAEAHVAKMDAHLAEWAGFLAEVAPHTGSVNFLADLSDKVNEGRTLSDKQVAAARRVVAERAAQQGSAQDVPEGRRVVEGRVVSKRVQEGFYGTEVKMLVEVEGFRVYGTVPAALLALDIEGRDIRFTATLKAKEKGFGFFSRPSKAELVA